MENGFIKARPYVTNGPADFVMIYDHLNGFAMEVECERCDCVWTAEWSNVSKRPESSLRPDEARALFDKLEARGHTYDDCIRFQRDLIAGRAEIPEQPKETIDW